MINATDFASFVRWVWLLVNEYKLINNTREINKRMMLEVNPMGLRLKF